MLTYTKLKLSRMRYNVGARRLQVEAALNRLID